MQSIGHVRDSYYYWFLSNEYLLSRLDDIILIGFQETLEADFNRLKSLLNLGDDLNLPVDSVAAHRAPSTQITALSDEARYNLQCWYAADEQFYKMCSAISSTLGR